MNKTTVFHLFYAVLLHVVTLIESLLNIWLYIQGKLVDYYYKQVINNEFEYVYRSVKIVNKLPVHLTFLLSNENPSYPDLANLVMWSAAAGISFVSFYDYKGTLKENEELFESIVESKKLKDVNILWHKNKNNLQNGYVGRKIYVKVLSLKDGRDGIVETTKKLAQIDDLCIDEPTLYNSLKNSFIFPDPDLAIYFNKNLKTNGYPPWQINTTEFLSIASHCNLSVHRFVYSLYRFGKIEQRFGK